MGASGGATAAREAGERTEVEVRERESPEGSAGVEIFPASIMLRMFPAAASLSAATKAS